MFSTVEDVQFYPGCSVLLRMFSIVNDIISTIEVDEKGRGYNQYCCGYSVMSGDVQHSGGLQYCSGCSVL